MEQNGGEPTIDRVQTFLENMLGLTFDQDVKQYEDVPAKRIMHYRVRRVVSPSEFYIEFDDYPYNYQEWHTEMQWFYARPENQARYKVIRGVPLPSRTYVCRVFEDGQWVWHRVRCHGVDRSTGKAVVFFLDLCQLKETFIDNLMELAPEFAAPSAQVFRAYLYDVVAGSGEGFSTEWSEVAIQCFMDMTKDKSFDGIVLSRSEEVVTQGMPDTIFTLGVVLVEARSMDKDVCALNAQMVDKGFASATGLFGGCKHFFEFEGHIPKYAVPAKENGEAEEKNGEMKCCLEDEEEVCDNGEMMTLEESLPTSPTETDEGGDELDPDTGRPCPEHALRLYANASMFVPLEFSNHLAYIGITFVMGPSFLVVQQLSKTEELHAMEAALETAVTDAPALDDAKPGTFVACHAMKHQWMESVRDGGLTWCRGVIMEKVERAQKVQTEEVAKKIVYKILLVDYGPVVEVVGQYVKDLTEEFLNIPSFAIRIHLDVDGVIPFGNGSWGNDAMKQFRKYLNDWELQLPRYFMFRHARSEILNLEDFRDNPCYVKSHRGWTPSRKSPPTSGPHLSLSDQKDHPLLWPLFRSIGVDINYEIFIPEGIFWHFRSIAEDLLEGGQVYRDPVKSSFQIHQEVVYLSKTKQIN